MATYYLNNAEDYSQTFYTATGALTTGTNLINFSGVSGSNVFTVPLNQNLNTSIFKVKDLFGKAATANIVISGSTSAVTFDGSATATISTNFGSSKFVSVSGSSAWITL